MPSLEARGRSILHTMQPPRVFGYYQATKNITNCETKSSCSAMKPFIVWRSIQCPSSWAKKVLSSQVGTASFFVSQRIILLAGSKRKETEWAHRKRNDPSLFCAGDQLQYAAIVLSNWPLHDPALSGCKIISYQSSKICSCLLSTLFIQDLWYCSVFSSFIPLRDHAL